MTFKKIFLAKFYIITLFLAVLLFPHSSFADDIKVRVHLNDLSGSLWTDENNQIKINAPGAKIGTSSDPLIGLSENEGGLYIVETIECKFDENNDTVTNPTNNDGYEKTVLFQSFDQLPAGEFLVPPTRFRAQKIIKHDPSNADYNTLKNNCSPTGKDKAAYDLFMGVFPDLYAHPFVKYSEDLEIKSASSVDITIDDNADGTINGYLNGTAGNSGTIGTISGILCKKNVTQQGVTKTLEGICSAKSSETTDLVVMYDDNSPLVFTTEKSLQPGDDAEFSEIVTLIGHFAIRASSLLDWSLGINETGFKNPKIELIFNKFLNIVNGFFILSLLVIAFLWNFSALLPKSTLKKLLALFVFGVMSVNFALPITNLLVDGTNILQRTLLVKSGAEAETESDADSVTISSSDIMSTPDVDFAGFVGLQKGMYIQKSYPKADIEDDKFSNREDLYIDRYKEHTIFNLTLIALGSIAQLLIALILVFRFIILWFLLIFSPFIFVLFVFKTTRYVFNYWTWLYFRWLFIGPILAMSLYITVNIWALTGVPLESSYAAPSALIFPNTTNLNVAAPGIVSGFLNTPREVMKYISALMMLYMSIILPFWLTRVKRPSGVGVKEEDKKSLMPNIQKLWKKDEPSSGGGTGPSGQNHEETTHKPINLADYKQFNIAPPSPESQESKSDIQPKPIYDLLFHQEENTKNSPNNIVEKEISSEKDSSHTSSEKQSNYEKVAEKENNKTDVNSSNDRTENVPVSATNKTSDSRFSRSTTKDLVDRLKILNVSTNLQSKEKDRDIKRSTEKELVHEALRQRSQHGDKEATKELEKINAIEEHKNIKEVSDKQMRSENKLEEFIKSKKDETTLAESQKSRNSTAVDKEKRSSQEATQSSAVSTSEAKNKSEAASSSKSSDILQSKESVASSQAEIAKNASQGEFATQGATATDFENILESTQVSSKKENVSLETERRMISGELDKRNLYMDKKAEKLHQTELNKIVSKSSLSADISEKLKDEYIDKQEFEKGKKTLTNKEPVKENKLDIRANDNIEKEKKINEVLKKKPKTDSLRDDLSKEKLDKIEEDKKAAISGLSSKNTLKDHLDDTDKMLGDIVSGNQKSKMSSPINDDPEDEDIFVDKKKQNEKHQANKSKTWEDLEEESENTESNAELNSKTTAGYASNARSEAVEDGVIADWSKSNVKERIIQGNASEDSNSSIYSNFSSQSKTSEMSDKIQQEDSSSQSNVSVSSSEHNTKEENSNKSSSKTSSASNNSQEESNQEESNKKENKTESQQNQVKSSNSNDEEDEDEILEKIYSINEEAKKKNKTKSDQGNAQEKSFDDEDEEEDEILKKIYSINEEEAKKENKTNSEQSNNQKKSLNEDNEEVLGKIDEFSKEDEKNMSTAQEKVKIWEEEAEEDDKLTKILNIGKNIDPIKNDDNDLPKK